MEHSEFVYAPLSFQEIMEAGKDAARSALDRRAYLGCRIVRQRPPRSKLLSTAECAALLGVTESQIKLLLKRGAIPGAKRKKTGRGRPWAIPASIVGVDSRGGYRLVVTVLRGQRGRNAAYFTAVDNEPPF